MLDIILRCLTPISIQSFARWLVVVAALLCAACSTSNSLPPAASSTSYLQNPAVNLSLDVDYSVERFTTAGDHSDFAAYPLPAANPPGIVSLAPAASTAPRTLDEDPVTKERTGRSRVSYAGLSLASLALAVAAAVAAAVAGRHKSMSLTRHVIRLLQPHLPVLWH